VNFLEWLREFNRGRTVPDRVGFFGLDLYSLHTSIDAVLHIDATKALTPLERWSMKDADLPETYPVGA
jgi:erythromycin esterase-like protein